MSDHELGISLSAYLDGELSREERLRVGRHLAACAECRAEFESLKRAKGWLGQAPQRLMPASAFERNEAWLAATREPSFIPQPAVFRRAWRAPAGMAACAAALLAVWLSAVHRRAAQDDPIPLDALLAAHYRYSTDSTAAQGNLVASNYSDGWAYDESQNSR